MSDASESTRRRQRHPRSAVHLPVRISTIDAETDPETGSPFFLSANEQCDNLSRGGLFVITHEPVPAGCRLLVEIEIPGGPEVQAIGRVAWSRTAPAAATDDGRPGIGIEFLGGSREGLSALELFVDRVERRGRRNPVAPPAGPRVTA